MKVTQVTVSGRVRFATSKDEATRIRHGMVLTLGVKKSADQMESVDIPTSKAALLPWLNNLLAAIEARVYFQDELPPEPAGTEE